MDYLVRYLTECYIQPIQDGISAGEQRVFPRTDNLAPPASSSSRILTHHQSASNVVHANGSCHIAFLLSLLGLDQRLLSFGACQSRGPKVQASWPVLYQKLEASGLRRPSHRR